MCECARVLTYAFFLYTHAPRLDQTSVYIHIHLHINMYASMYVYMEFYVCTYTMCVHMLGGKFVCVCVLNRQLGPRNSPSM